METSEAVTRILDRVAGALLEKARFGRSERALYRLKAEKLPEIARALKEEAGMDWLENLSALQQRDELVFTYFLRSSGSGETAILRVGAPLGQDGLGGLQGEEWVRMPSVSPVWRMAALREAEISRLFGVRFSGGGTRGGDEGRAHAETWDGFPLRKSFDVIGAARGSARPGGVSP